ncbi:hypothetical protein HPB50_007391 [Hyalomma asiaticum]|uniref:Uncharacterized protein n=1 Tax=Hyalomma asiaticum TaxID=266040 RepID=A0ACB7SHD9_HYAAI|nr:hypothetical protein HPB50_007391 [Hyalomma asiaticum]
MHQAVGERPLQENRTSSVAALILPDFRPSDFALWFVHTEAQFRRHRVISQAAKYNNAVSAPNPVRVALVLDILLDPLPTGQYGTLKRGLQWQPVTPTGVFREEVENTPDQRESDGTNPSFSSAPSSPSTSSDVSANQLISAAPANATVQGASSSPSQPKEKGKEVDHLRKFRARPRAGHEDLSRTPLGPVEDVLSTSKCSQGDVLRTYSGCLFVVWEPPRVIDDAIQRAKTLNRQDLISNRPTQRIT